MQRDLIFPPQPHRVFYLLTVMVMVGCAYCATRRCRSACFLFFLPHLVPQVPPTNVHLAFSNSQQVFSVSPTPILLFSHGYCEARTNQAHHHRCGPSQISSKSLQVCRQRRRRIHRDFTRRSAFSNNSTCDKCAIPC